MAFVLLMSLVIGWRIGEILLSRRNEQWLLAHGAVEYGKGHYPFMVALHVLFIISVIVEYSLQQTTSYSTILIVCYMLLLALKTWPIASLGKFWCTKIYRIPGLPVITRGPYAYVKHPNYMIVAAEIAVLPLAFRLYDTAIVFTVLNAIMLAIRIRDENSALRM